MVSIVMTSPKALTRMLSINEPQATLTYMVIINEPQGTHT